MRFVIYEEPAEARLRPLTWLRPASSLLLGAETTESRWRRLVQPHAVAVACRPSLVPLGPGRTPLPEAWSARGPEEIWVSGRVLPDPELVRTLLDLPPGSALYAEPEGDGPHAEESVAAPGPATPGGMGPEEVPGRIAFRPAGSGSGPEPDTRAAQPFSRPVRCRRILGLADLIRHHEELLPADLERLMESMPPPVAAGDGHAYGLDRVRLGAETTVDHGAVIDAREGPVVLGPCCRVFPHTWIRGPFVAGEGCLLLGGRIGSGTSLGPGCRVHGEVEASVFLGRDNKAHDGFVGHSYLGEWVNLGAFTTTSDLKNNYSPIVLEREGTREPTGLRKLGVFFGDHVKTRIGALLGCGTILGVGVNLIGDPAVTDKWVRDFSWGWGPEAAEYAEDRFLRAAEIVLGRRNVPWSPEMASLLSEVHAATRRRMI